MDRGALSRATDSSESPTPGYLYLDLSKNAASSPQAASDILTYLLKRLTHKSPNVKFKSLKVLTKIAASPVTRGQFKRQMANHAGAIASIKECLGFRGVPDPIRGDVPYQKVRDAAKECLEMVYSDDPATSGGGGAIGSQGSFAGGGNGGGGYGGTTGGGGYGGNSGSGGYGNSGGGGYGNNSYGSNPGGVAPGPPVSTGSMQGIGNPMFSDPRASQGTGVMGMANMTVSDVASTAVENLKNMVKDPFARNVSPKFAQGGGGGFSGATYPGSGGGGGYPGQGGGGGGFGTSGVGGGYGGPSNTANYGGPPGAQQLSHQTGGAWNMASNRGPNAVIPPGDTYNSKNDLEYYKARDAGDSAFKWAGNNTAAPSDANVTSAIGGVRGGWGASVAGSARAPAVAPTPSYNPTNNTAHTPNPRATQLNTTGTGGNAIADGSYEARLIADLCPPGGRKPEPPPDKLAQFAASIPSLNPDFICPPLLDSLEDGQPWIIKAKALCVMEVVLTVSQRHQGDVNPYSDFFHECVTEIEPLATHPRVAIAEPAKKVLLALGLTPDPGTDWNATKTPKVKSKNLTVQVPPQASPNLLDFGDMTPAVEVAVTPPVEPTQPAPATTSASLFGGLTVQSSTSTGKNNQESLPPPNTPPRIAAPTQVDRGVSETSLLDDPVPSNTQQPSSAFSFMSAGGSGSTAGPAPIASTTTAPAAAAPAAPIDSFGTNELLALGTIPAAPITTAPAAPQPMKPQNFDPLLSSSNAFPSQQQQQQANVMNPMQLQAAYQQQVIRMQQMQMASMMQNQKLGGVPHATKGVIGGGSVMSMHGNKLTQVPFCGQRSSSGSFSFLEDPTAKAREEKEKKFDFIQAEMSGKK